MTKEEAKAELHSIRAEEVRRIESNKYKYYTPIGKTEEFLDKAFNGKGFVHAYLAANGIGKTAVIANIMAHLIWPCGSKWFQQASMKKWPHPLKRARLIADPTTVKAATIPALREWFPEGRYTTEKMQKSYDYLWESDTGWQFDIMTYDQSLKEFESVNLDLAIFDEPPPEPIFEATVARMRRGGIILILCTPLNGAAWLYDKIVINPNRERDGITLTEAEMEDACRIHGVRGFLEHHHIETMIKMWDPDEIQARVFGKFKHLAGLVFKSFNRDIHIVEPFAMNRNEFVWIEAFDSHPRNPDALMWLAMNQNGTMYITDEYYNNAPTTDELVADIEGKRFDKRLVRFLLEPAAYIKDQHQPAALSTILADKGLNYVPGSKRRGEGIRLVKDALRYQMKGNTLVVPPKLFVFSSCIRTIYEFTHWQWSEWASATKDKRSPREVPEDKDDHMMENLGRILLDVPVFEHAKKASNLDSNKINHDPYDSPSSVSYNDVFN